MTNPHEKPPSPTGIELESVPADDLVIAHAFKWSLVVLAAIGVVVAGVLWFSRGREEVAEVLVKDPGSISGLPASPMEVPALPFTDVTEEAGIDFVHVNGATGERMLPESMGGGAAFFDEDGDGDQDLFLVSGRAWPWDDHGERPAISALYRNDGSGRFDDVTEESGLGGFSCYGMGVACGDYDGDGDVDLFVSAVGPNHLWRNDGGIFVDVTAEAGVAGPEEQWSSSAAFFDEDRDGDLDLFVASYVQWSRDIDLELNYTLNGRDRAYGPPTNFKGAHSLLYRNNGDGTFTDVSAESGIQISNPATGLPVGKSLGVLPIDLDGDGYLELIVSNDTTQNFLFENQRDGKFRDIGPSSGVAFDGMGQSTGAMGVDAAHFRNDLDVAVGIGNFANEMTSLYVKQGQSLQFSDDAIVEGVGSPSRQVLSFGLFFFDADLDGRLDLLQANGHLEEEINQVQPSQQYRQPAQLFWNCGKDARSTYTQVPNEAVGDLATPIVGRGATYADIDGDGDLDVLLTQIAGPPLLLRNDQQLGHHWVRVRLVGPPGNRDAIGAWIELTAGGVTQRRQVMPSRSYLSQVELPVTFGLGQSDRIDGMTVTWPDGTIRSMGSADLGAVDRELTIVQK